MADFLLDPVAGNDANDGTTFANRWKTFNSGATAARIAPNDRIKVIADTGPTALSQNASFTNASRTVTLTTAVTADIDTGDSAWTSDGGANVVCSTSTTRKEGTNSATFAIGSGFTTGLAAHKAIAGGPIDFSGYEQISFWLYLTAGSIASSGQLQLKLCSDTLGATPVDTFDIPAVPLTFTWHCFTVNKGSALGNSIGSIALYVVTDVGAQTIQLDNIIACKAVGSADSLSLNSLIAKVHALNWEPLTTYAVNTIRKPTTPNRNGYCYKVTSVTGSPGHSGSSEPTWPQGIGETVSDGEVVWTCNGLEEPWFGLKSIRGTTLILDAANVSGTTTGQGYTGVTESVGIIKREPLQVTLPTSSTNSPLGAIQDSGTQDSVITFSGGWNRTDMSTQTGESWITGRNGSGLGVPINGKLNLVFEHFGLVRFVHGFQFDVVNAGGVTFRNCQVTNCSTDGFRFSTATQIPCKMIGCQANNCGDIGVYFLNDTFAASLRAVACFGNLSDGLSFHTDGHTLLNHVVDLHCKNNGNYGINGAQKAGLPKMMGVISSGNINAGFNGVLCNPSTFFNSTIDSYALFNNGSDPYIFHYKNGQVADTHLIKTEGAQVSSATDQRHTASDVSWKFEITNTARGAQYPVHIPVMRAGFASGALVTLGIWVRRNNTNIKGKLIVRGGQVSGVGADVSVACEPSINTWTQYTLSFTPTEAGVVEAEFECWDGVGTTNILWIDDESASQA